MKVMNRINVFGDFLCTPQIRKLSTSYAIEFSKKGKKIIGIGLNYKDYLQERGLEKPKKPQFFFKPTSSYVNMGESIIIPEGFYVNEEIQLGAIIGKPGKYIKEKDAMDHVEGYCAGFDLTATNELRIAKAGGNPWALGKGFDTACPVSCFLSKEEIKNPNLVKLWAKINGNVVQDGNTSDLIFPISYLISYLSKYMKLESGDVILTGSPSGSKLIKPGDKLEGGITGIVTMCFKVLGEDKGDRKQVL